MSRQTQILAIFLFFLVSSCKKKEMSFIDKFSNAEDAGAIENNQINEASGIVESIGNINSFWINNDSGDPNRIFLYDKVKKTTKEFYLEGAENRDWEAISISNFNDGVYLYIADIGDNNNEHQNYCIYKIPEPKISDNAVITNVKKITYKYPDGAKDAECILLDHISKDIYILTKREPIQKLYRLSYPQSFDNIETAEFISEVTFSNANNQAFFITDGNISLDNQEIIIKNYFQVFHWRRKKGESIGETLKRKPQILPYLIEPQGEGVCYANDLSGYFTVSEESGDKQPVHLFFYKKNTN